MYVCKLVCMIYKGDYDEIMQTDQQRYLFYFCEQAQILHQWSLKSY